MGIGRIYMVYTSLTDFKKCTKITIKILLIKEIIKSVIF